MNTTNLLVDILIIGVQVMLWIAGFIFSFVLPYDPFARLLEESPAAFAFLFIAASYTLGIVFDYLFSLFFRLFRTKEEEEAYRGGLTIEVINFNNEMQKYIDNQYARLRIARATVCNIPLITISACCFIMNTDVALKLCKSDTVILIAIVGTLLTILTIISWWKRKGEYFRYVKEIKKIISKTESKN